MKRLLWAGLIGLALLAVPAPAHAGCFSFCWEPCKVNCDFNACFHCSTCVAKPQCGPWYLYWPMEAHFGPPAPTGYPAWPPPMTLPGMAPAAAAAPYPVPPPGTPPAPPPPGGSQQTGYYPQAPVYPGGYQPVGYFPQTQAPSYWYPR